MLINSYVFNQYIAEYKAVLDAALYENITVPSERQKSLQNNFLKTLKDNGILSKTDVLQIYATDGSFNFSKLNFKNSEEYRGSVANNPYFSKNGGIKSTGTGSWFNTNWAPSYSNNYQLSEGEIILYMRDIVQGTGVDGTRELDGSRQVLINPQSASNQVNARTNGNGGAVQTNAQFNTNEGLYFFGRLNTTQEFVKKDSNPRVIFTGTLAPKKTSNKFVLGGMNQNSPESIALPNTRKHLLFWSGGLLTTDQETIFKSAWDTYLNNITSTQPEVLGVLYEKNSWTGTSEFINNGATVSVVSNKLRFSGGTGSFTQTLDLNRYTALEYWKITIRAIPTIATSTSYGFGVGIRSTNTQDKINVASQFGMATGFAGRYYIYAGTSNSMVSVGTSTINYTVGDEVELTFERNENQITVNIKNHTTNSAVIGETYTYPATAPFMHNTGRFAIFSFGGLFDVTYLKIESNCPKDQKLAIIGDSKTVGYNATNFHNRYARLLRDHYNDVIVLAGGTDKTAEVLTRLQEVIDLRPKAVLMVIGSNDSRFAIPSGTTIANYNNIVTQLTNAGIRVIHSTGMYESGGVNQNPLRNHILTTYNSTDVWDSLIQGFQLATDNVHPADEGMQQFAKNFIKKNFIGTNSTTVNNYLTTSISGDGVDDYLQIRQAGATTGFTQVVTGNWTFELWAKLPTTLTTQESLFSSNPTNVLPNLITINAVNNVGTVGYYTIDILIYNSSGSQIASIVIPNYYATPQAIRPNLHMILTCKTISAGNYIYTFYLNGGQVWTTLNAVTTTQTSLGFQYLSDRLVAGRYSDGSIMGTRFYTRSLTNIEAFESYNGGKWRLPFDNSCIFDFRLNKRQGNIFSCNIGSNLRLNAVNFADINNNISTPTSTINLISKRLVFEGNSLIAGTGSSGGVNGYKTLPLQTLTVLNNPLTYEIGGNLGIAGQTTTQIINNFHSKTIYCYDPNKSYNIYIPCEIINELYFGTSATAAYNNYVTLCMMAKNYGFKVVACTPTPRSNSGTPGDYETKRQQVITLMRANWTNFADALADFAANTTIGDSGDELNTTYYGDLVHLTDAGYLIMANILNTAINTIT